MLSVMDRTLLDFERNWLTVAGPKDQLIESDLGLSSHAYYERLLQLITDHHARAYDPLTVRRVTRMVEPLPTQEGTG